MEGTQLKITVQHETFKLNCPDIVVDTSHKIGDLKQNFFRRFGTSPETMILKLKSSAD